MDFDTILDLLRALHDADVQYCVVGGVALALHGLPRATAHIDLFVAPDPQNVERLKGALHTLFADPEIDQISAADLAGDYPAVQYVPPSGAFHIDFLARLGEAFRFADIEAEDMQLSGVPVRVATARMLYRMKKDTVRLQDRADAERLKRRFGIEEA